MSFRPLSGIKVSEHSCFGYYQPSQNTVSVPSRGLRYLNMGWLQCSGTGSVVSVPSRGVRYLNLVESFLNEAINGFRPLAGS